MRKDTREERKKQKKKVEDLEEIQKTTDEGTSGGVAEKSKFQVVEEDNEQDEDYKYLLRTNKGTKDQEDYD